LDVISSVNPKNSAMTANIKWLQHTLTVWNKVINTYNDLLLLCKRSQKSGLAAGPATKLLPLSSVIHNPMTMSPRVPGDL